MTQLERLNEALTKAFYRLNIYKKGDMAKYLDYKQPYFSGVINGKEDMSESFLNKISDLGINIDWIRTGEGNMLTDLSVNDKSVPSINENLPQQLKEAYIEIGSLRKEAEMLRARNQELKEEIEVLKKELSESLPAKGLSRAAM